MELVDLFVDNQSMTGVVTSLETGDHVSPLGEPIHDLAFSLVAPLCANNHYIRHVLRFP